MTAPLESPEAFALRVAGPGSQTLARELRRYVALVRFVEREECALVAERFNAAGEPIADAIRKRGA